MPPARLYELEPLEGRVLRPLSERPMLVMLSDEEGINFRSINLLSGPLHARCFGMAEFSHPCWNDATRAMSSCGLKATLLKGTLVVNHHKGPFRSGRFGYNISQAGRPVFFLGGWKSQILHPICFFFLGGVG